MAARKTADKWEPIESLGTTGETVAGNVKRLRIARGLAYTELSARLLELKREIPTWGLRKIESGGRRVDVDDLLALAVALEVSPITFLMPPAPARTTPAEATGAQTPLTAESLWGLLSADRPLPEMHARIGTFRDRSWPQYLLDEFEELDKEMRQQGVNVGDDQ